MEPHLQQVDIGINIGSKRHFDNMVDAIRSKYPHAFGDRLIIEHHLASTRRSRCRLFA
jgi:hypothetical protein